MEKPDDIMKNEKTPALRSGQPMLCPKCKEALFVGYKKDTEVDYCSQCSGIWVDMIEEKNLLNIKPDVFSIDDLKRLRKLYKPLERRGTSGYVPCPVCRELMQRRNWGSYSGVIVDKCADHGTWYDNGELEKIKEFIALGGVEFEKYKLADSGLTELDQKLAKEVHRLDQKIDSSYRRARFYSILGF